jgi:hypothetical protein
MPPKGQPLEFPLLEIESIKLTQRKAGFEPLSATSGNGSGNHLTPPCASAVSGDGASVIMAVHGDEPARRVALAAMRRAISCPRLLHSRRSSSAARRVRLTAALMSIQDDTRAAIA